MRWPFRRRPQAGAPSDSHGSRAESATPPARRDWATLPAIEQVVGPAPLIAQRRAHHPGLPGAPVLERALAPLGHHLSSDAPGGMVSGLAVPVATAPAGPLPLRGIERHPQLEPASVGEMPDLEPVRVLLEADPSPPPVQSQMAPSLTRSPDPYSSSSSLSGTPLGAAVTAAQRVTAAAPMQRSQPPGGAESAAHIPGPRPSLGRSRRLGIGVPFSRTVQPSGDVTSLGAAGASAPLPSPPSSVVLTAPASLEPAVTVDPPATSASPTLPATPSSTAATPDVPDTAGTPAVHTSPAARSAADTVMSVQQGVPPPSVQRAAHAPVPSATPPAPTSSLVPPPLEVTPPRHPVLPDRARLIDATSSDEPATPVQREPAMTIDRRAPWRGPLAGVERSRRHEPAAGPSAAPTEGPVVSRELPAPIRPSSPPGAAVRDSSTTAAALEGDAAGVFTTSSQGTDVAAPPAHLAEVQAEPPATTAAELPLPPPVSPQRTSAPPSSSAPAPVTRPLASPPVTLQRSTAGVLPPPSLSEAAELRSDLPAPSPSAVTAEPGSASHGPVTAPPAMATTPTHRPTVARTRLAVAAPLLQPLHSPSAPVASLPSAAGEWVAVAAHGTSTTSPPERPGWQLSPVTADRSSGRGLPSIAAVQRDATLDRRMTQPVDLPLPLRASGSSTPRDETVAQAATAAVVIPQRAIEEPGPVPALPLTNVQQQATAEPATPAAAGAGGPSGGRSEGEMEELARRLYEHIGTRLRAELLVERERAGMVTDLR